MKKFIALLLVLALALSSVSAFAEFPDLEEERWDWARDAINEMTDTGVIAGYTDGNFGPADGVTKLQSLLLMARILGFYEPEMEYTVKKAREIYGNTVEPFGVTNPDEVAFLMYYGIINESELPDYLENPNEVLKRYEAAIILTKTAGAETEVLANTVAALKYSDTPEIPSTARRYVNYVTEQGYMVGMTETTFEPNTDVTRAQMAVMLYRIMKKLEITYLAGNFVNIDTNALSLIQDGMENRYTVVTSDVQIRVDGVIAEKESLPVNGYTVVKFFGDTPRYIDSFTPVVDKVITGTVTSLNTGLSKKINITPVDGSDPVSVTVSDAAIVTLNGSKSSFNEIKRGDTLTISVKGGVGETIDIALREEVINNATFKSISYEPYATVTFTNSSGTEMTKALAPDVSVARNNKLTEIRELVSGDKLIISLKNDIVSQIKATSIKSEVTGTIEAIHLSSAPYLIVRAEGESSQYNIANDISVIFDETTGTIYDLRVGSYVTLGIESDTVKSITSSTAETAANTIVGIVENINNDYNFFYLNVTDSASGTTNRVQVFVKKSGNTKFIDGSDGTSISLGKMDEGCTALVTGTQQLDGSYIATAIVVIAPTTTAAK